MHGNPDEQTRGKSRVEAKREEKDRQMLSNGDQDSRFGDDSRKTIKIERGEGHTHSDAQWDNEEPMHRDIHVNDDRVVFDHVFEIHDDCRSDKGEAEPD